MEVRQSKGLGDFVNFLLKLVNFGCCTTKGSVRCLVYLIQVGF